MSYTPQILIDNKNNYPNEPALSVKQNNEWQTLSWSEYYDFVIKISKSLIAEGYTVNGIHMKSGILALACGSDGLLLYEWNGFDSSSPAAEVGRLDSDYAYNVKVFDEKNIFAATRAGVQLFQIGD